jgi:16S rRNA C967 or C1407 C5-methylase (RsmB/RsmF family)
MKNPVRLYDETELSLVEEVEEEDIEEEIDEEEEGIEEEETSNVEGPMGLLSNKITWEECFNLWKNKLDPKIISKLPEYTQLSFSQFLYEEFVKKYGKEAAIDICKASNQNAPITVRINELKISREDWMKQWSNYIANNDHVASTKL